MLDNFRDSLFALRDKLYDLAADGRVTCDSEAYRGLELFLNGMIRYAHRFTFLTFLLSSLKSEQDQKEKDSVHFAQDLVMKIMRVDDEIGRTLMLDMLTEVRKIVYPYLAKTSLFFMLMAALLQLLRLFRPIEAHDKQDHAVYVFEREAYLAAKSDRRMVEA